MHPIKHKSLKITRPTILLVFSIVTGYGTALLPKFSASEVDACHDLPHSDFLSAQDLDRACDHRKMWIHDRDAGKGHTLQEKLTDHQLNYLKRLEMPLKHMETSGNINKVR
jgi:hypothetical protein